MAVTFQSPSEMTNDPIRVFIYGAPRRGKTTLAATFPAPVFLSSGQEGGDRTLQAFPNVAIAKIRSSSDMEDAVARVRHEHTQRGWRTVVVDSLTFYAETYIAELTGAASGKPTPMDQQRWGRLEMHLTKWLMPTLHALPLHVVWIALEKTKDDQATGNVIRTEPMLSGATAQKLPACTDLILYADQEPIVAVQGRPPSMALVMRTANAPNRAIVGGRFWNAFPAGYIRPTFEDIARAVGDQIGEAALAAELRRPPPAAGGAPKQ